MQLKCLDSLPLHIPRTYHDVGEFACGFSGRMLVSVVTTLEYFGYACMQLILLWHQLEASTHTCGGSLLPYRHHHAMQHLLH